MIINMIGSFVRNDPFGTEIAFAKGLKEIGVGVNTWDPSSSQPNLDDCLDADATIIFKDHGESTYEYLKRARDSGQTMIEYQPDDVRAPGIRGMMEHMRQYCDYAFTFDSEGARVADEIGYKRAKMLLVTADTEIYRPLGLNKMFNVAFVGSMSNPVMHESRREMMFQLETRFDDVVYQQNTWNPYHINEVYNRSKIVVNHACDVGQGFGLGYGYQCRHFEAGFAGSCLVSNVILDAVGSGPQQFCTFSSIDSLIEAVGVMLEGWYDGPLYEIQGDAFYDELMADHTPRHRAEEIVSFIKEVADEA